MKLNIVSAFRCNLKKPSVKFSLFLFIDLEFNLTAFLDLNFLLLSSCNKEVYI